MKKKCIHLIFIVSFGLSETEVDLISSKLHIRDSRTMYPPVGPSPNFSTFVSLFEAMHLRLGGYAYVPSVDPRLNSLTFVSFFEFARKTLKVVYPHFVMSRQPLI